MSMTAETSNARGEVVLWPTKAKHVGADEWQARTGMAMHVMDEDQARVWNACLAACKSAAPPPAAARGDVRGLVAKLAAHVRPTCSELWDEARAFLAAEGVQAGECCVPDAGEPSFVLLGRDPQAPALIEAWAADRERAEPDSDKPAKARAIAAAMREFKAANPSKGLPASALSPRDEGVQAGEVEERVRKRIVELADQLVPHAEDLDCADLFTIRAHLIAAAHSSQQPEARPFVGVRCPDCNAEYVASAAKPEARGVVDGWKLIVREDDIDPGVWAEKDGSYVWISALTGERNG